MTYTLKQLRQSREKSKTQQEVANILGISRATFNELENNPQNMKILTVSNLSKIYRVSARTVFVIAEKTWKQNEQK